MNGYTALNTFISFFFKSIQQQYYAYAPSYSTKYTDQAILR